MTARSLLSIVCVLLLTGCDFRCQYGSQLSEDIKALTPANVAKIETSDRLTDIIRTTIFYSENKRKTTIYKGTLGHYFSYYPTNPDSLPFNYLNVRFGLRQMDQSAPVEPSRITIGTESTQRVFIYDNNWDGVLTHDEHSLSGKDSSSFVRDSSLYATAIDNFHRLEIEE